MLSACSCESQRRGTYRKPREKTPIKTAFCAVGKGSLFSRGSGIRKMKTSVTTFKIPMASQKVIRSRQSRETKGSQFFSIGWQFMEAPIVPPMAHAMRKAKQISHTRWNWGRGNARRYWKMNVILTKMTRPPYPIDAIQMSFLMKAMSAASTFVG
jgi:hypothetical protein